MSEILRYVLVDKDDHEQDFEYQTLDEAIRDGAKYGMAVIEHTYVWDDSSLMWTPNGSDTWPPKYPWGDSIPWPPEADLDYDQ